MSKKYWIFSLGLLLAVIIVVGFYYNYKGLADNFSANSFVFQWDGQSYSQLENQKSSYSGEKKIRRTLEQEADIDDDGENERAIIKDKVVYVYKNDEIIWQSNPEWQAENVILADVDNDGQIDIVISLWKFGKYGPDLPFWLEENINDWGNHLFIYKWQDDQVKLFWGSSTIDAPIREMRVADVNQDDKNELVVLEGVYNEPTEELAKYLTIWFWQEWSFFNDFRSSEGRFLNLDIDKGLIQVWGRIEDK